MHDDDFAILNAIYLKKMAGAALLADVTGLTRDDVEARLAAAAEAGLVIDMGTGGAMLLEDGTGAVLAYYRDTYAPLRALPELTAWYETFEAINARFIAQVTAWQQSEGDERAERKLLQTAERLARDIAALVPHVPRYAAYVKRFGAAMDRVDRGEHAYVCNPSLDSIHNIWFEFHEDILAVLGRPRDTT